MSIDSKLDEIESARNTIRSKMVAAGQASSSDKLADLADNLTFEKYYSIDDSTESTLANDDYVPFYDTSATAKKKSTWNNIKSKLKTYFDTLYPSKTTFPDPTSGDSGKFLRGDSTWQEISAGDNDMTPADLEDVKSNFNITPRDIPEAMSAADLEDIKDAFVLD